MSPLADPENPPAPCRCLCPDRDRGQNRGREQNREQNPDQNWGQNREQNQEQDHNRHQNWDQNRDQDRNWNLNRDQNQNQNHHQNWNQHQSWNQPQNQSWNQPQNQSWNQHQNQPQNQNWDRDQHQHQNWNQNRDWDHHHHHEDCEQPRSRSRCRSRFRCLAPALAALAAAALGAAAAAAAVLGALRGQSPAKAATAAHLLLSAGSLSLPSSPAWRYQDGVRGVFLSGDIRPEPSGTLRVTSGGLYLLYGQLGLRCTATNCPQGRVTLRLARDHAELLAVPLTLPAAAGGDRQRSALTPAVEQLWPGDVLSLELLGDVAGDSGGDSAGDSAGGWQLEQDEREGNFVGLLRIAGG